MGTFETSTGERVKKSIIDRRVRISKGLVLQDQLNDHGYNFCVTCGHNDCKPVTCAHLISVDECQKSGRCELAWDPENIIPEGLPCHQIRDGLNIG